MNPIVGRIRNGIAYLGVAYFMNCAGTLFLHPYSDFDAPSELVDKDRRVVEETLQVKERLLENSRQYFSERGINLLEEEIENIQVQLGNLTARKDSLRRHEDEVVGRRVIMPWTYITDKL